MTTVPSLSDAQSCPSSLIIIGAGMAGIKLALSLLQDKPSDMAITILEANDYVGGRIRSFDFEGHTVEMGANWISGLETKYQNPVWELAKGVKLDGHFVDRGEECAADVVDTQGNDIRKEYFEARERFENIHEHAIKLCAEQNIEAHNDIDVRSLLEQCGWPSKQKMSPVERLVEYNMLEVWIADSLSSLSSAYNMEEGANDVDLGNDEFFVEDKRGFNCILAGLVEDLQRKGAQIHLNEEVQSVCYTPGCVSVTTCDGKKYNGDAVASTVSLGVLQNNKIEFSPPLPDWKTKALNQVGMFLFSKVYAKFNHDFWSNTNSQIVVCSDKEVRYPLWMRYRNTKENIFMCYLGGSEARRVESLSTEEIQDELEELFRSAFSNRLSTNQAPAEVFRPEAVAVTSWSRDPHFCGSYSVYPTNAFSRVHIEDLTQGLTGTDSREGPITLYFAGEAFDDKYNGWVQGAYRSGERLARSILGEE